MAICKRFVRSPHPSLLKKKTHLLFSLSPSHFCFGLRLTDPFLYMLLCEEMVGSSWKKYFPCLRPNVHPAPSRSGGDGNSDADPRCSREGDNVDDGPCCSGGCDNVDALLWHKDLCPHVYGEFSMAVVQANPLLEDHSQVESGPLSMIEPGPQGTFAGIYDGHGGPEVARFINQKLFANVKSMCHIHFLYYVIVF